MPESFATVLVLGKTFNCILTLPYLTFGLDRLCTCPALRPYQLGPTRNPECNRTEGHISLLVVLANRIRDIGWTLLSSSSSSRWDPKMEYLSCILAGHVPRKWKVVSFSSPHAGQSGSFCSFITLKCLSVECGMTCKKTNKNFDVSSVEL